MRARTGGHGRSIRVWDLGVRLFHWLLVGVVAAALVTGLVWPVMQLRLHLIVGGGLAVLLFWRVVWGLLGTRHARFADFAYAPRVVLRHVVALRHGYAERHLGHNPPGAMMVFALLLVIAAAVATGVIVLGGALKQGPLRAFLTFDLGWFVLGVHQAIAWVLLGLIALHIAGVAFESWRTRENLSRAMLDGRKLVGPAGTDGPTVRPRWWLAGGITVAGLVVGAGGVAALAALPGRGVPPSTLDATYAEQCGACHMAYPPSLAPAATWNGILADLQHHFGADASLSTDLVAHIRAYLLANSAEHWDTLPAHMFRHVDPRHPLRITDTPYWRHMHSGISQAKFAATSGGRRSSCDGCHKDAETGRFAPQAIELPKLPGH